MAKSDGKGKEIRQFARYQVRPGALERCLATTREFVAYVRANKPGTLRYEVWQERDDPTRFVHVFVFRDAEADRIHIKAPIALGEKRIDRRKFAVHLLERSPR